MSRTGCSGPASGALLCSRWLDSPAGPRRSLWAGRVGRDGEEMRRVLDHARRNAYDVSRETWVATGANGTLTRGTQDADGVASEKGRSSAGVATRGSMGTRDHGRGDLREETTLRYRQAFRGRSAVSLAHPEEGCFT